MEVARSLLKVSTSRRAARLRAGHGGGGLNPEGFEIMTEVNRTRARRAFGFLILLILVAGTVFPAFGQRRRTRPRLRKYTRPAQTAVAPTYYTVPADTVI